MQPIPIFGNLPINTNFGVLLHSMFAFVCEKMRLLMKLLFDKKYFILFQIEFSFFFRSFVSKN